MRLLRPRNLTFAVNGGEQSYHRKAADDFVGRFQRVHSAGFREFKGIVKASRGSDHDLGVIAVATAAGTVDESAAEIVRESPDALPTIIGRVDVLVQLAMIAAMELDLDQLRGYNKTLFFHGQKPAWEQCEPAVRSMFKRPKPPVNFAESTQAIKDVIELGKSDHLAIGPRHAAEPLGGHVIGPDQINPSGSITSFYVLARDPTKRLVKPKRGQTSPRTVITLAHPEGDGEMDKVVDLFERTEISVGRFINFAVGDFTKHRTGLKRAGGIFELQCGQYDDARYELFARIAKLTANDGAVGPFSAKVLGEFPWYEEAPINLGGLLDTYDGTPTLTAERAKEALAQGQSVQPHPSLVIGGPLHPVEGSGG
jgi:prephenate dehydratase